MNSRISLSLPALALFLVLCGTSSARKALSVVQVTRFSPLQWWDKGSGGSYDGSFWKPQIPLGYYALGSLGQSNYGNPNEQKHVFVAVKADGDPAALAHPVDYQQIWTDRGSGADLDGSFWLPIPPRGYVALGLVAMRGYNKPLLTEVVCVKKEYTVRGKAGAFIWNDRSTGSDRDFGAWRIEDYLDFNFGICPGTFVGVTSHSPPAASPVFHCLSVVHAS